MKSGRQQESGLVLHGFRLKHRPRLAPGASFCRRGVLTSTREDQHKPNDAAATKILLTSPKEAGSGSGKWTSLHRRACPLRVWFTERCSLKDRQDHKSTLRDAPHPIQTNNSVMAEQLDHEVMDQRLKRWMKESSWPDHHETADRQEEKRSRRCGGRNLIWLEGAGGRSWLWCQRRSARYRKLQELDP
ncbi:hypothetical protein FQA47_011631 [Oryzias melastigma]|uniref:Uncharacterized protein n=1 Tax=Oryzias melastigma TaxID=30732 RepID=A0A834CBR2_ORYME|nr:hypothetical protein FQA47_011631 [Oryzias melastigma]